MVKKIPSINNQVDLFTKILTRRVFYGHRDNIDVRCVVNILEKHDA